MTENLLNRKVQVIIAILETVWPPILLWISNRLLFSRPPRASITKKMKKKKKTWRKNKKSNGKMTMSQPRDSIEKFKLKQKIVFHTTFLAINNSGSINKVTSSWWLRPPPRPVSHWTIRVFLINGHFDRRNNYSTPELIYDNPKIRGKVVPDSSGLKRVGKENKDIKWRNLIRIRRTNISVGQFFFKRKFFFRVLSYQAMEDVLVH